MKKIILLILILANFLNANNVISLKDFEGKVYYYDNLQKNYIQITKKADFPNNTLFLTDEKSYAEFLINNNDTLTLNEESKFKITVKKFYKNINLFIGSLKLKVKKLKTKETFKVTTPVAVCGVRGTEFAVNYEDEKVSELDVIEGKVEVENASKNKTYVTENSSIDITKNKFNRLKKFREKTALRWGYWKSRRNFRHLNIKNRKIDRKLKFLNSRLNKTTDETIKQKIMHGIQKLNLLKQQNTEEMLKIKKQYKKINKRYGLIRKKIRSRFKKFRERKFKRFRDKLKKFRKNREKRMKKRQKRRTKIKNKIQNKIKENQKKRAEKRKNRRENRKKNRRQNNHNLD